jgi:hypothetical protein
MMSCILCCSSRQILCRLQNTSEGSRELDGGEVGVVEVEKRQRAAGNLWHGVRTPDALNRIVGFGGRVGSHVDMRARVTEDARHFVSDARGGVGDEHDAAPLWGLVGLCEQGARAGPELRPEALEGVHGGVGVSGVDVEQRRERKDAASIQEVCCARHRCLADCNLPSCNGGEDGAIGAGTGGT